MKKQKALTLYVIFSIAAVLIYTVIQQYIFINYPNATEMSTLTTCFFAFFGGEVTISGLLKLFKIKGGTKNDEGTVNSEDNEPKVSDGPSSLSGITRGIDNGDSVG